MKSSDNSGYAGPSDDEFWTVVQKVFSFDEPSRKWSQLRKSLRKQLRKTGDKVDLESLTLLEQGDIFAQFFGNGNARELIAKEEFTSQKRSARKLDLDSVERANQRTSFAFALEDLRRFRSLAFDLWMSELNGQCVALKRSKDLMPIGNELARKLSATERTWLELMLTTDINWCRLLAPGPWQEDERAIMVREFLEAQLDLVPGSSDSNDLWERISSSRRCSGFLPDLLLLVEGATESILLPRFGHLCGLEFKQAGIAVFPCGGSKQVVRNYLNWKEVLHLPVVCLLDADAAEHSTIIRESLREGDRLICLQSGEIEDTFHPSTLLRLVNDYLSQKGCCEPLTLDELNDSSVVSALNRALRARRMGDLDKVDFAAMAIGELQTADVPEEARGIVRTLEEVSNERGPLRF